MPRARNIKPSIFKNEDLGVADPILTLLFESLWCLADRRGRLEDRPLRIKAETFPYREIPPETFNGYLTELQRLDFIRRYRVDEISVIQVVNFEKHQSPHHTEKESILPPNPDEQGLTVKAPLSNGENPLHNALIPDSLIPDSRLPDNGKLSGRAGISREYTPTNQSSDLELNIWLDAVAVVVGAKDRHGLPKRRNWETVCMSAMRNPKVGLDQLIKTIEMERERTKGEEQFFSPDTCLQKMLMAATTPKSSKWMHDV